MTMAWTTVPTPQEEEKTVQPQKMNEEEIRNLIEEKLKELRSK